MAKSVGLEYSTSLSMRTGKLMSLSRQLLNNDERQVDAQACRPGIQHLFINEDWQAGMLVAATAQQ